LTRRKRLLRNIVEATYGIATSFARLYGATILYHANIKEDVIDLPWLPDFFKNLSLLTESVKEGVKIKLSRHI
jgi:hypothetical protein